jgi:hypothetical protein
MIDEFKEEMYKQLNEFKEDRNTQLTGQVPVAHACNPSYS